MCADALSLSDVLCADALSERCVVCADALSLSGVLSVQAQGKPGNAFSVSGVLCVLMRSL